MKQNISSRLFLGKKREEVELTQKRLVRNNTILLLALVVNLFIPRGAEIGSVIKFFALITISVIVYSSSMSLAFSKRFKNIIYPLSGITILFSWVDFYVESEIISMVSYFLLTTYFFVIGFAMIVHLIIEKKVKASTLLNAVNSYLFLGYIFSFIFLLGEIINKLVLGSTHYLVKFPEGFTPTVQGYLYYSFVTLTTLGYGDIIPITRFAQMLAVIISVSGQVYMTMLLALLVGRFISEPKDDNN
jgi:hypothetical protein